eukprot:2940011-Amphidinium_carterae.1
MHACEFKFGSASWVKRRGQLLNESASTEFRERETFSLPVIDLTPPNMAAMAQSVTLCHRVTDCPAATM